MEPVIEPGMTPGQRIKLFRTRAGLTQEVCAQLKGVSLSAWRKWESGERQVLALHDWIEIARILRVRDLFRLTGLPVGQLPDEPTEHESVPPIREALYEVVSRPAEPVDPARLRGSVEFAWEAWHGSPSRYSRTGPMLPELIRATRGAVAAFDDEQRRDAYRVLATMYQLVRAYCKRVGSPDLALLAADRMMAAAQSADDTDYIAAAAWNIVTVVSGQGYVEAAATVARNALTDLAILGDEPSPERLAVTGSLNLALAIQEARLRNEHAMVSALANAERAAGVVGENNVYRMVFGPTNVALHQVATSLELSRSGEARRVAEHIDVTHLPSVERRFAHYLDLAKGYALGREDLAAVSMLARAERESAEEARLNIVFRAVIRELLHRETPTTRPELRPIAERAGVA